MDDQRLNNDKSAAKCAALSCRRPLAESMMQLTLTSEHVKRYNLLLEKASEWRQCIGKEIATTMRART
eukprot:3899865-Amphidinium_carterae.1